MKASELKVDNMESLSLEQFEAALIEAMQKAEREAWLKGIETNAVILNEDLDMCKEFYLNVMPFFVRSIPPMILGKQIHLAPLPKDYIFALTKTNVENEAEKLRNLFKKYVKTDGNSLRFKNISFKKNIKDFEYISSLLGEN